MLIFILLIVVVCIYLVKRIYTPIRPISFSCVKLGVACMTKNPNSFETWIDYHRKIGICHFFIKVENTPGFTLLGNDITLTKGNGVQTYRFWDRQNEHVNNSIKVAKQLGITHLLHIDDDELLYCPKSIDNFYKVLSESTLHSCLRLKNYESVAPHSKVVNPFKECKYFNTNTANFTAYANGKSIACLKHEGVRAKGAHLFSGNIKNINEKDAVVLHYESMVYSKWKEKFENYLINGNKSQCDNGKIPFKFYCQSMDTVLDPQKGLETWSNYKLYKNNKTYKYIDLNL